MTGIIQIFKLFSWNSCLLDSRACPLTPSVASPLRSSIPSSIITRTSLGILHASSGNAPIKTLINPTQFDLKKGNSKWDPLLSTQSWLIFGCFTSTSQIWTTSRFSWRPQAAWGSLSKPNYDLKIWAKLWGKISNRRLFWNSNNNDAMCWISEAIHMVQYRCEFSLPSIAKRQGRWKSWSIFSRWLFLKEFRQLTHRLSCLASLLSSQGWCPMTLNKVSSSPTVKAMRCPLLSCNHKSRPTPTMTTRHMKKKIQPRIIAWSRTTSIKSSRTCRTNLTTAADTRKTRVLVATRSPKTTITWQRLITPTPNYAAAPKKWLTMAQIDHTIYLASRTPSQIW